MKNNYYYEHPLFLIDELIDIIEEEKPDRKKIEKHKNSFYKNDNLSMDSRFKKQCKSYKKDFFEEFILGIKHINNYLMSFNIKNFLFNVNSNPDQMIKELKNRKNQILLKLENLDYKKNRLNDELVDLDEIALNLKENYFDTEIKNGDYLLNGKPIKPSSTLNLIKEISNSIPERKPKFIK